MQIRTNWRILALALIAALVILAPQNSFAQKDETIPSTAIPAAQVFSCGSGFTFVSVGISSHGNVSSFTSPSASGNHIYAPRSGYALCVNGGTKAYDAGSTESGWAAVTTVSQPNGPNTFPLEITRNTSDFTYRVVRRITGNSFVGPVTNGNATYDNVSPDGQGCSRLLECGNCTNRTIHVLTRVTNFSGVGTNVGIIEFADFDVAGGQIDEWARTGDSVIAWDDPNSASDTQGSANFGMLLQTLISPASTGHYVSADGVPGDCIGGLFGGATPVSNVDRRAYLLQDQFLGSGSNTGGNFRVHYRRF